MTILLHNGVEINDVGRIVPVSVAEQAGTVLLLCWDTDGKRIVPAPSTEDIESITEPEPLKF